MPTPNIPDEIRKSVRTLHFYFTGALIAIALLTTALFFVAGKLPRSTRSFQLNAHDWMRWDSTIVANPGSHYFFTIYTLGQDSVQVIRMTEDTTYFRPVRVTDQPSVNF